jgi:hypothetical protein
MSECVGILSCKRNQLPFSQNCSPTLEIWFHNLASTWPWNSLFTIFPSGMNSLQIILKNDQCCFNPQICKQFALVVILFSILYSDRSGWSSHEVQLCVPFAHPWDLCGTDFAHIFLFCKPSWRIWWNCFSLNVQWILDQFLWSFDGLWLSVYELLQLFTDSRMLTAGHSLDHLQGFKVLTFSLNLVNHSDLYMQDRAFLYTIMSIMFVNVAVS